MHTLTYMHRHANNKAKKESTRKNLELFQKCTTLLFIEETIVSRCEDNYLR